MAQESPSRDQDKFMVRMPEGMRERIAEEAKANGRSMNAEIVARLEQSLPNVPLENRLLDHLMREKLRQCTIRIAGERALRAIGEMQRVAPDDPALIPETAEELVAFVESSVQVERQLRAERHRIRELFREAERLLEAKHGNPRFVGASPF